MFKKAFETQLRGEGFSFVEILTMCPTGWFIPTADGPGYLDDVLAEVHVTGDLKVNGHVTTTEERKAETASQAAEFDRMARAGAEPDK